MRRSLRRWHLNKDLMELSMWMPLEDSFSERKKNQCKGPEMRMCLEQQGGYCDWSSRVQEERADRWQVLGQQSPECQGQNFTFYSE